MKIEKILLIAPNANGRQGNYKPLFPPLGLMQIAALTPRHINVEIVDESVQAIDFTYPADLVGISVSMSAVRPRALEIARKFRLRGVPVVLGGVDPTFAFEECAVGANYVFRGEAEGGWVTFLNLFEKGEASPIFRAEPLPDLSRSPMPARQLLNPDHYAFFNSVQSARGCPNNCDFCSVWLFSGREMRYRPLDNVLKEIEGLPNGIVIFTDDNIIADFDRAKDLFTGLKKLRRRWFAQSDMTLLSRPDLVRLAAESGCVALFVGFESFNPESLRLARKSVNDVTRYRELIKLLHHDGIAIIPAMIFGFDSDKLTSLGETARELHLMKADAPQFSVLTPLPGTQFFRQMKNRLICDDLILYDGIHTVFQPAQMSADALETGVRKLYSSYYRPRRIIWRLISDPLFWRHPFKRLRILQCLFGQFAPRIWRWVKRNRPRK